ncbi:MAG: HEPN domain-containing protein [Nanoarchaeota archaeon]|nr:HEPN domain-containing protein [Nanoarchaeota archaeon]
MKLVEASKEVSKSYAQKSNNSFKAARILLAQSLLEESTSMAYYAMFHKVIALFRLIGIKCENHAATIILLKELFGIQNKEISFAKQERVDKQYYTEFKITKNDVEDMINKAEEFIEELDLFTDRLTEDKVKHFKEIFEETYF